MLSDETPNIMDERDCLVVEFCQALQVLVFALGRERVDGLVAIMEVRQKRICSWPVCQSLLERKVGSPSDTHPRYIP